MCIRDRPYTGQRFNAAQHTAVLSDGEAKLLQGSVRLLSAASVSYTHLTTEEVPQPPSVPEQKISHVVPVEQALEDCLLYTSRCV